MATYLFIGADANVTLTGIRDAVTGSYLNSASPTWTLQDTAGNAILDGDDTPIGGTIDYVAASNGDYRGVIDGAITADLTSRQDYVVVVDFSSAGYDDVRHIPVTAMYRGRT